MNVLFFQIFQGPPPLGSRSPEVDTPFCAGAEAARHYGGCGQRSSGRSQGSVDRLRGLCVGCHECRR